MSVLSVLGGAAKIAGAGLEGVAIDRNNRAKRDDANALRVLAERKAGQDAESSSVLNAFRRKQTEMLGQSKGPTITGHQIAQDGTPYNIYSDGSWRKADIQDATATPIKGPTVATPAVAQAPTVSTPALGGPPQAPTVTPARAGAAPKPTTPVTPATPRFGPRPTTPPNPATVRGSPEWLAAERAAADVRADVTADHAGARPSSAVLQRARAANMAQIAIINDALTELEAHPKAVGLTRGLPGIGDRLDTRTDPAGVGARASIANIGSLKMHDRSGAAVSVSEFPRLAPFIPAVSDPPEAIRVKLKKLLDAIQVETDAMAATASSPGRSGGAGNRSPGRTPPPAPAPDHTSMSDEEFTKAWNAGQFRNP